MSSSGDGNALGTLLFLAAILGFVPAIIANRKGLSFGRWWLFGALFFILALPLSIMASPEAGTTLRKCPSCAEWVQREAKVCKHCGRDMPVLPPAGWYPVEGVDQERYWDGIQWTSRGRSTAPRD